MQSRVVGGCVGGGDGGWVRTLNGIRSINACKLYEYGVVRLPKITRVSCIAPLCAWSSLTPSFNPSHLTAGRHPTLTLRRLAAAAAPAAEPPSNKAVNWFNPVHMTLNYQSSLCVSYCNRCSHILRWPLLNSAHVTADLCRGSAVWGSL